MGRIGVLSARSVHIRFVWHGRLSEVSILLSCRTPGLCALVLSLRRDVLCRRRADPCVCVCTPGCLLAVCLVVRPSLDRAWDVDRLDGWALSTAGRRASADMRTLAGSVLYGDPGKVRAVWQ